MNDELEKLKLHSPDWANENIRKLAEIFPNCVTETQDANGTIKRAIDYDQLRQELSDHIVDGSQERYHLNWPGKREALLAANAPIAKTLRPARDESVNFDTTQNLFIEGDNLEALKLLQETYLGKVKMIYIDPPYNTGNDFIYEDDFAESSDAFLKRSNQKDEIGSRLVANPESEGRFHSDWLSMIYSRLRLAKNLLADDGVIFISIDDNEINNMTTMCREVFGDRNFLYNLIWHLSSGPQAGHFTRSHEYVVAVSKNKESLPFFKDISGGTIKHGALKKISSANPASEINFPKGCISFEGQNATFPDELGGSEKQFIKRGKLRFENGLLAEDVTIEAGWAMKNQLISWMRGDETFDSKGQQVLRFYFNSQGILFYEKERGTQHPKTVLSSSNLGGTKAGGDEIHHLFGQKLMSFPKPLGLIKELSSLNAHKDDLILDFFAGSSTTAHAVIQLNAEDGGNRKFIMVQLPEEVDPKSEATKAGYSNIAEISKERIRRAGAKILEGKCHPDWNKDIGFRVLKVDTSNMKDVYYRPDEVDQTDLLSSVDNIKNGRTGEDLLFQVLVDWGVDLTLPIRHEKIEGKSVYFVDDDALIACFETGINIDFVKQLATHKPLRVVFRDNGFASDDVKANVAQIFRQTSPDTDIKVI
ncbi:site-specific DNA-methyltransferase [Alphaproteobacteria bacterium]|nr:site-specific DNA-methyltransferase [Alphaproteobacteria bacterium]